MYIMKHLLVFIVLAISSVSLHAQSSDTTMTKAEKEKIINVFYNCWDTGSREKYEQVISKDLVDHDRNPMMEGSDFDGLWGLLQSLQGIEMKHDIEQIHYLESNKVLVRWKASAKHVNEFFGIPASNKIAYYAGHDILQLNDDGQIAEIWHIEQIFQLMEQLKPNKNKKTTSIEENEALVRRFFAAIESGDLTVFDQIVAVDYNDHLEGQSPGRETLKLYFTALRSAFADLKLPISAIVAERDLVAVLNSVEGTHKGQFGTLEATGNQVNVMAFQLYRIANGQLAEHWEVADMMTLMRQLKN